MIFIYQIKIIRGYVFLWPGIGKKRGNSKKGRKEKEEKEREKKEERKGKGEKEKKGGRNLFLVFDFKSD